MKFVHSLILNQYVLAFRTMEQSLILLQVIVKLRGVVAFMNKSTYSMEHFDYQRKKMKITRGIESIGETRFGTLYWSGKSVLRGLPALKVISADEELQINITVSDLYKRQIGNAAYSMSRYG